jgi:predicted ArsR family transcriptional regulator
MSKLGRKVVFGDKFAVIDALAVLYTGAISRYLKLQLVEQGFLKTEDVKHEGRGRPSKRYIMTSKAKSYMNISKNWKRV